MITKKATVDSRTIQGIRKGKHGASENDRKSIGYRLNFTRQNARMSMHEQIKAARKRAGLTQTAVADACGVTRAAVSQWESPDPATRTTPRMAHLETLAALTDSTVASFLSLNHRRQISEAGEVRDAAANTAAEAQNMAPIIEWDEVPTLIADNAAQRRLRSLISHNPTTPSVGGASDRAFALRVGGTTFTVNGGSDAYMVVDPEQVAKSGDRVVAILEADDSVVVVRTVVKDGTVTSLQRPDGTTDDGAYRIAGRVASVLIIC